MTWSNWSGSVTAEPAEVRTPRSTEEVVDLVTTARDQGRRVKPVGAGHSFTAIARPVDIQIAPDGLTGPRDVDLAARRVTLGAGTRLHRIPELLAPLGLAMVNLGDIDRQTIAGAVSTGTHGTGLGFGGLATQVVGLTLVDGTGTVRRLGNEDDELAGGVIGLGALGVVTEVTLQLTDAFALRAVERPEPLDRVLDTFVDRCRAEDHLEFYWFPHTRVALTKTNTRLPADAPLRPLSPARRLVEDELLSNRLYEGLCRLGTRVPRVVPTINRLSSATIGNRTFTDRSDRVFATSRQVRFHESEWAVPLEALPQVQREIDAALRRRGWSIEFPLEFRAAAGDDRWLSTAYGRETGYVAAHRYHRNDPADYLALVGDIARAHDGRPHWGKQHRLTHTELAPLYPRYADFVALRDRLDPDGVMANDELDRVLPPRP